MERWPPAAQARERSRPRRRPGQPSFSSTLLDAICDAMDEQPGKPAETEAAAVGDAGATEHAAAAKKQREAALHWYYYYKPSLAASHRAARVAEAPPGAECHGRGYFSSSEVEYSLRHGLRPIRTAGGGAAAAPKAEKQTQPMTAEKARKARKQASHPARRPASPGARLAGLLNAIFTGKRHSARQHPAPPEDEPTPSTTAPPSNARSHCSARTPPSSRARPQSSRSRTVRFLDIDGEVAVAAAVAGRRHIPVMEVEEVLFRHADTDVGDGEESSDASSDLFELENLDPAGGIHRRALGDELPVYGTTAVGRRRDIGRRRPFGYGSLSRSYSKRCLD